MLTTVFGACGRPSTRVTNPAPWGPPARRLPDISTTESTHDCCRDWDRLGTGWLPGPTNRRTANGASQLRSSGSRATQAGCVERTLTWPKPEQTQAIHLNYYESMQEHWIQHPASPWVERFWRNPELQQDRGAKAMAIDRGRVMPGAPALLKTRTTLTLHQARELWTLRIQSGWQRIEPQW